jgi:hypothetical protein
MGERSGGGGGGCFTEILAGALLWWIIFGGGCTAIQEWTRQHTPAVQSKPEGEGS